MYRVAFEACGVGILHAEIADRPGPRRSGLIRRRRRGRIGRAVEEHEGRVDLRRIPGYLRALGRFVDAKPHAIENFRKRQSTGADHLGERLRVGTIGPRFIGRDSARRGIEGDQHVRIRLDQREPARDRLAALDKGLLAGHIQHDDVGLQRQRRELAQIVADPQSFDRNVGVAAERRVDRDEIILAGELHAIARKIHHRDRARS